MLGKKWVWSKTHPDYLISDEGDVVSFKTRYPKLIKKKISKGSAVVWVDGQPRSLNKIVWEAFKHEIPQGFVAINKHGLAMSNDIYSMILVTRSEATRMICSRKRGKRVKSDKMNIVWKNAEECARQLHYSKPYIVQMCNGNAPHNRLKLHYIEDDEDE